MNLTIFLIVLLVCLYQEGVQAKRGRVRMTIQDDSPSNTDEVLSITMETKCNESVYDYLNRAVAKDIRFQFTTDDGVNLKGMLNKTNDYCGFWEVVVTRKNGREEQITGLDRFIPKACDKIVFKYHPLREFYLVFSAKSGTEKMIRDSWLASDEINADNPDADLFKSPLAELLGVKEIEQVKIEVLQKETGLNAYFLFNGTGADKGNFMSLENVIDSSYGNLTGQTIRTFSVDGYFREDRTFFIEGVGGSCESDKGWMVVVDNGHNPNCDWMERETAPYFMFCGQSGPCVWKNATIGDTFRILLKISCC